MLSKGWRIMVFKVAITRTIGDTVTAKNAQTTINNGIAIKEYSDIKIK